MRTILISVFTCLLFTTLAQTYTVKTVPNTKLVDNSYVSNPDQILSESTVAEINAMLAALEQQTSAQVAVVAINDIGDSDDFSFAQELFNEWGIGQAKEDNGLLMLVVLQKRKVRLQTGYGLEGDLPDIICKHIEMQKMVPHFKNGDYNTGVLEGVREVTRILGNVQYADSLRNELYSTTTTDESDNSSSTQDSGPIKIDTDFLTPTAVVWSIIMIIIYGIGYSQGKYTDVPRFKTSNSPNIQTSTKHFIVWFVVIPVAIMIGARIMDNFWAFVGGFYAYLGLGSAETRVRLNSAFKAGMEKKDYYGLYNLFNEKKSFWTMVAIFIPIPFAFMFPAYKKRLKFLREHPRECGQCGKQATRHSEITEDPFLSDKQKFEEKLQTVDYDVWQCDTCKAPQVLRYPTSQTTYEACAKCGTVAYYVSSTRTLQAATEDSEGLKEETKTCKYCKFVNVRTYSTPKLSKSSSSSGGSSGSSGGSWGGGSSGGGGASSSW